MKKLKEWPQNKKIVAVDFDGTITLKDNRQWIGKNKYINDIKEPNIKIINQLIQNRDKIYLVLWTCRKGKALKDAITFCNNNNIYFDAVNENIVRYPTSRKIMADIYLDDKGVYENWTKKI